MTRFIIPILVALAIVGTAPSSWAYEIRGVITCGKYLDVYSKSTLTRDSNVKGPHEMWGATGFIDGFISAYNAYATNEKQVALDDMSHTDSYKWIASWCRDNPSKAVNDGIEALIWKFNPVKFKLKLE